jgi:Phosphotransferase enzyme family
MFAPRRREVRLVLVGREGDVRGALPWLPVATPWWQDVEPVVAAARQHGVDLTVLRLLSVDASAADVARVTYLAETAQHPREALAWSGTLDEHPLRLAYAKPGGPAADLAWVEGVLRQRGSELLSATQVRTWNLSSHWRLATTQGPLWLKVVPPFFAHEGALLSALPAGSGPQVVAHDGCRVLMEQTGGDDLYGATGEMLWEMVERLVGLQRAWAGRAEALLQLGVPDARQEALAPALCAVLERHAGQLSPPHLSLLERFVDELPSRFTEVAACGLPDTLVHGDAHPGNFRGGREVGLVLIDWGDCVVGNPMLDESGFLGRLAADDVPPIRARWHALWRAAVSGSDPERAERLLAPVGVARGAVVYQGFLDRIEPSEHPYHRGDPLRCLRAAAVMLEAGA